MPPSFLRHSCRYCLRYCSDMRTEVAGNMGFVSLYRPHACEVDSSSDVPAVKTCDVSCWRRPYFLICRSYIAGSTDGYVAGTSAVSETRFQSLPPVYLRSWHEFDFAGTPAVKTSSYVGVVLQAVPTAASRVLRRHMKTRLKSLHWVLYPLWISRDTESGCNEGYCG